MDIKFSIWQMQMLDLQLPNGIMDWSWIVCISMMSLGDADRAHSRICQWIYGQIDIHMDKSLQNYGLNQNVGHRQWLIHSTNRAGRVWSHHIICASILLTMFSYDTQPKNSSVPILWFICWYTCLFHPPRLTHMDMHGIEHGLLLAYKFK